MSSLVRQKTETFPPFFDPDNNTRGEKNRSASVFFTLRRYDSSCGSLTGIDYSDSTPDVTFTYDRLGRQRTIADGTGTRTFAYNDALQLAA